MSMKTETPDSYEWAQLVEAVVLVTNISVADIEGRKRIRRIARARQILCYLAREYTDMTLSEVGVYLGGRDHTTVIYGASKVKQCIASGPGHDAVLAQMVQEVLWVLDPQSVPNPVVQAEAPTLRLEIHFDPPRVRAYCLTSDGDEWEVEAKMVRRVVK